LWFSGDQLQHRTKGFEHDGTALFARRLKKTAMATPRCGGPCPEGLVVVS
jgi:hypothetical protein